MTTQEEAIFAPVIEDFYKWRECVSSSLTDLERMSCYDVVTNIGMPHSAWNKPQKHPLSSSFSNPGTRTIAFENFYCLRLIYIDHYRTLYERTFYNIGRHEHSGVDGLFEPQKVRNWLMGGSLAKTVRRRYGEAIFTAGPERVAELYLQHRSGHQEHSQAANKVDKDEWKRQIEGLFNGNKDYVNGKLLQRSPSKRTGARGCDMNPSAGDDSYAVQNTDYESGSVESSVEASKKKKPASVACGSDSYQTIQGFGMKLSDEELLEHVERELRQCRIWEELEDSMKPKKLTKPTKSTSHQKSTKSNKTKLLNLTTS